MSKNLMDNIMDYYAYKTVMDDEETLDYNENEDKENFDDECVEDDE